MTSEDKHKSTYPSESPSFLEETNEATKSHQKGNSSVKEGDSGVLFPSIPYENSQDSHSSLNGTTEPFAEGLINFLTPVIQEMDGQIDSVKSSQLELQKVIERLLNELQLFVDTNNPPHILPAVQKLVSARKRLVTVNTTLKLVQERLDRLLTQME
ncbi:hypothetical protein K7432_002065 [Basidiobolus ranarum]|uniref:Biogenesis of lysosome-related organelles complex 1 subunit 7 n=1 Tax=Basidiobolus ranarum TaxID=34480 RepID=A0ABR2W8G9_9FUNG